MKNVEELAVEHGRLKATPVIRSMYPSISRGEMTELFADSFRIGYQSRDQEMNDMGERITELSKTVIRTVLALNEVSKKKQSIEDALKAAKDALGVYLMGDLSYGKLHAAKALASIKEIMGESVEGE